MNYSNISRNHHYNEILLVPYSFKVVLSFVSSVAMLVSAIGNILVITSFVKTLSLRNSTNSYITSMAVSDLLFVAVDLALYASSRLFVLGGSVSSFQCKFGRYIANVSYSVSIESLVLMTVDRYIAIVYPMKVILITGKMRTAFILASWIIPMGMLAPFLHYYKRAQELDGPLICTMGSKLLHAVYTFMGIVLLFIIPLIVIVILNSRIMKALRTTTQGVPNPNLSNSARRHQQNRKIIKTLIAINVIFFACWTLYYLSIIFFVFFEHVLRRDSQEILVITCLYLPALLSTVANPVILFIFSKNYRQALKNCFRPFVVKCRSCLGRQEVTGLQSTDLN